MQGKGQASGTDPSIGPSQGDPMRLHRRRREKAGNREGGKSSGNRVTVVSLDEERNERKNRGEILTVVVGRQETQSSVLGSLFAQLPGERHCGTMVAASSGIAETKAAKAKKSAYKARKVPGLSIARFFDLTCYCCSRSSKEKT